jgi:membrane associated rhomboid family serine protease
VRRGPSLLFLIYIGVGLVVAATHHYFAHLGSLSAILSAILAVVLWPLVLLGINLHIKK